MFRKLKFGKHAQALADKAPSDPETTAGNLLWFGAALLTPDEAAALLRVTKGYLAKLRVEGGGPRYVKLAKRVVLYRKVDLVDFADSRLRRSTSDTGGEPEDV